MTRVAGKHGDREVDKLTEVLKFFTASEARQLVVSAHGRPTLCSYSNDGTPIRTTTRAVSSGSMGKVVRVGGAGHELLVQRAFFRTRGSTGEWQTAMQVRDPLPLVHGKGADAIFSAAVEFLRTLRQMNHGGIAVQHYSFDRALHTPLVRRFRQHHAHLASAGAGTTTTGANAHHQPALLEWLVDTPCANHDVHNALKWGMQTWMSDCSLMKSVFIVVESIRNGFSLLEDELSRWILGVVDWADDEDLLDPVEAAALWGAVGVEPKWVDHLVDMGLLFRNGRLLVSRRHRDRPDVWTDIVNCIRHSMRFTQFSDSRWCTLGRCCRQLLHSQLLGLDSLVRAVLADPATSDYLIGGWRQRVPRVQEFVATAAFAAYPPEALLAELLDDDRLCLHYHAYHTRVADEFSGLLAFPEILWQLLAEMIGEDFTSTRLRSQAIGCAHTAIGFVGSRVWKQCQGWPWKLAIGDLQTNVKDLAALDSPPMDCSVARKVWTLANQGYPMDLLVDGVQLLQHVGWTSTTVEQQHASASLVRKLHHGYGLQMLCSRALLHTARLFYSVDPLDQELHKHELRLQEQLERTPARVPANAMMFKKMMEASAFRSGSDSSGLTRARVQDRMRRSNAFYSALPPAAQQELRDAARIQEVLNSQKQAADVMVAQRQLLEARLKKKLQAMSGLPPKLVFSTCVFGDTHEERLQELMRSDDFRQTAVEQLRKAAMQHGVLSEGHLKKLDSMPIVQKTEPQQPWWIPVVSACRDVFRGAAVVIRSGGLTRYYKFLFAKKSPRMAVFSPLELQDPPPVQPLREASAGEDLISEYMGWSYYFKCDRMVAMEAWEIDSDEQSQVYVISGLVDRGEDIVADGPLYVLSYFVQGMSELQRKTSSTRAVLGQRGSQSKEQKDGTGVCVVCPAPIAATPPHPHPHTPIYHPQQ